MSGKNVFVIFIICIALFVLLKVGPIIYRGTLGIRGVCAEQIDRYKKYGSEFVMMRVDEQLKQIGVPKDHSKYSLSIKGKQVYLDIHYWDTAVFYKDYKKDFDFKHQCYSETHTYFK
ncbi:MAG: hypothetical protein GWO07_03120 [Candidatus Dadabacteria bacterium]|nr:hypothetical protein [Candidatus Dadabacteria bacterium]NIS07756.1 hypothetical protein [Candidatus Dadabacteria bacterium]NIV40995.1 hypothetical protein [Candidatus Dadabacteria bacterium]NIX14408.1 hypothetical protein [Candidatus Dadabacteria bacterium]NIY20920.1 hypothetical protein [Candidatus Dadabacteria bacterium]